MVLPQNLEFMPQLPVLTTGWFKTFVTKVLKVSCALEAPVAAEEVKAVAVPAVLTAEVTAAILQIPMDMVVITMKTIRTSATTPTSMRMTMVATPEIRAMPAIKIMGKRTQ